MLIKDTGIVLKEIKHTDKLSILKIYSQEKGIASFFLRKSKKTKPFTQSLSLLTFCYNEKGSQNISHLKDINTLQPLFEISSDVRKSAQAIFICEILYKTLFEEEKNAPLFNFLINEVLSLEKNKFESLYHINFLLEYSQFLGFYPSFANFETAICFDLREGKFLMYVPKHSDVVVDDDLSIVKRFFGMIFDSKTISFNSNQKYSMLKFFMKYYQVQMDRVLNIKSIGVLKAIFE